MTVLALLNLQSVRLLVIEGHRDAKEAVVGTAAMRYLPFDVPEGVTSIDIATRIGDREGDRDTVDLGLFDPRGTGREGFRGWQGGTRRAATLTGSPTTTSPWTIAGPLPAGRWHLAQYYLAASSKGLDYRYDITFHFEDPKPPKHTPTVSKIPERGLSKISRWHAGNLHAHSLSSDGALTLDALATKVRADGFDFLVSTEHNTPAAHWLLADAARRTPGLLLIQGTEVTTPGGHANVYGGAPGYWWDFRTQPGDGGLPRLIREVKRQRGLFVVNHPYATCTSCLWRFNPEEWREADGIEVWNGPWDLTDEAALALWDGMLREGRRINAYGGTDYHRDPVPLVPATRVWTTALTHRAIMDALRRGRAIVTERATGRTLELSCKAGGREGRPGDTIRGKGPVVMSVAVEGSPGARLTIHTRYGLEGLPITIETPSFRRDLTIDAKDAGYVRLELREPTGRMIALTNPVYFAKG